MCGIAGYVLREQAAETSVVKTMCDQMVHRGPDDEGYFVDGRVGLGMRRLSIIDLNTGHQPIGNEDGRVWVVFNGEIYNYRELRSDLLGRGHHFTTNSDTETVVHLYEEYGVEGLSRLRGMFAFAMWDAGRRQLLLVRDRFGKKPLYVAALPKGLYFASEMQCLQAAGVPLEPDQEALRLYFQFLYVPDPLTAFRAVRKLPPGSYLMYEPDTGRVEEGRYWRLPVPVEKAPTPVNEETLCAELRRKFDEAVKIRMIADVPLGAFLSGGMDSSSVVASMALQSAEPVKTFSIGFEERGFNELPYARMVAQKYRTEHHELVMRPDAVSLVEKLVQHFGEPFGDSSAIPTYLVSEFAGQHVKVVLTGDGGDELFGGYESFFAIETNRRWDRVPGVARRGIGFLADWLPYSAWGKNYLRMVSRPDALTRYFENNYSPYFMRQRLLTPEWMLPGDAAFLTETFRDCLAPNGADVMTQAMYFEATAKLTGDMLVKVDRMSMANSIEVRCPMLDHELAELAQDIPHDWKVREGRGKYILIRALGSRLPAGLLDRPKMGFGVPLGEWFRGPLREMLWSHLAGRAFLERGIVSPRFVKTLLEEHQSGRRDNGLWLWALLMLELWFRNLQTTR